MTRNDLTIPALFFQNVERYPDRSAFVIFHDEEKRSILYQNILRDVKTLARYLSRECTQGDRIMIYSENRPEWCIAYLAIVSLGMIAVPIDAELGSDEYLRIVEDSEARLVFCSGKTAPKMKPPEIPAKKIVNFDEESYHSALSAGPGDFTFPVVSPGDVASLIYTSGTTGVPKGVMLTHANFCSDAEGIIQAEIVTRRDNVLAVLPLHHTYAFMCTFLVPFFIGATITYPASLKGPDLTHAIKESGVTILLGVPQLLDLFYGAIIRNIDAQPFSRRLLARTFLEMGRFSREKLDLNIGRVLFSSVHQRFGKQFRFMASGGARLSPDTMRGLEAIGFTVLEGYGLTETSPVVTFNPITKRKAGSVGKPLEGVEIRIEREPGMEQAKEGEIVIRGDMVMKGYYRMPLETERVLKDGWFSSGDLGYLDDEGYLFITGRKKEVIVLSSGKNIYPEEVEKAYQRLPLIKEIGVFEKQEEGRVTLHALIIPDFEYAKQQKIANIHETLKWGIQGISLRLPPWMRLNGFTLSPNPLPRTRLGKIKRFQMKEIAGQSESTREIRRAEEQELGPVPRKVIGAVQSVMGSTIPVQISDNLELDLGIDSLKRIELAVGIEKLFSLSLPETFLLDVQTVAELAEKIRILIEQGGQPLSAGGKTFRDVLLRKPDPEQVKAIGLKQNPLVNLFVRGALCSIALIFRLYFGTEVKGRDRIPEPPFILLSNHASYIDAFFIASHIPFRVFRNIFFQGAQQYFRSKPMRLFARVAHVIPIDPDSYLASALALSAYVLGEQKSLCIFPEGGRSMDGGIMPFRGGIGILSSELRVPMVPVRLEGTFEAMPRGRKIPKRVKLTMIIGHPIPVEEIDRLKGKGGDGYQAIADLARERVEQLL
ncbi:MAG: AMP-binding protein [bacterium]